MLQDRLSLSEKLEPFALIGSIGIGILLAKYHPALAVSLDWVITFGLFLLLYCIFISIKIADIGSAFKSVRPTAIALTINFVLVPPYSWLLGYIFLRENPDVWVGLIIYLVTPCIGWYLIFTDIARGNVPLGVSILPWNVLLQIALMPVYLYFFAGRIIFLDIHQIVESVTYFLVLPFILGQLSRSVLLKYKGRSFLEDRFESTLSVVKFVALVLVIIAIFASQGVILLERPYVLGLILAPTLVYFFSIFVLVNLIARVAGLSYQDAALLSFTTTARNSEASVAIAVSAFPDTPLVPLVVAIGSSIELPVLIVFLQILRLINWNKI